MQSNYKYFCPRCGKPTQYNEERRGLCIDCFVELKGAGLKQENFKLEITVCIGCSRIKHGNAWLDSNRETLNARLHSLLRNTELKFYDFEVELPADIDSSALSHCEKFHVLLNVLSGGQRIVRKRATLRVNKAFCPLCSQKQSGKYYESIIHIRFSREVRDKLMEILNRFVDTTTTQLDRLEVIDVKKEGSGIAIRFSDRKLAKKLLSILNREFSLAILRKYKTPVTLSVGNKQQLINIDVFIIRLFQV